MYLRVFLNVNVKIRFYLQNVYTHVFDSVCWLVQASFLNCTMENNEKTKRKIIIRVLVVHFIPKTKIRNKYYENIRLTFSIPIVGIFQVIWNRCRVFFPCKNARKETKDVKYDSHLEVFFFLAGSCDWFNVLLPSGLMPYSSWLLYCHRVFLQERTWGQ